MFEERYSLCSGGRPCRLVKSKIALRIASSLIALTRLATHADTKLYMKRRIAEGKTKEEAFHCLKRNIAREIHKNLAVNPCSDPLDSHRSIPTVDPLQ